MYNYEQYLYIDSKILGVAHQIVSFFKREVFGKEKVCVLIKRYKHASNAKIAKILASESIKYCFVTAADCDALTQGVVFYPFNAQSNVRMVANRNLIHIFVTHGESHKISSIKPIIRVYDYIITAGDLGVQRFLKSHILKPYEIDDRVIKMGDTFIGATGLNPKAQQKVIFYAPTWEGGIEQENYSSLSYINEISHLLSLAAKQLDITDIIIKPHPNTGHRNKLYFKYLLNLCLNLKKLHFKVYLNPNGIKWRFFEKYKFKKNINFINSLDNFSAAFAFCDISAIETQLLNENIPYYLCYSVEHKNILGYLPNIYSSIAYKLELNKEILFISHLKLPSKGGFYSLKNHTIKRYNIPLNQRIKYLLYTIKEHNE